MLDQTEEWKVIPGFTWYEVSNLGRARNWYRYYVLEDGTEEGILKLEVRSTGKLYVQLREEGKQQAKCIATIICELFNSPKPNPKSRVIHKDQNLSNNRSDNLYWGTFKEYRQNRLISTF